MVSCHCFGGLFCYTERACVPDSQGNTPFPVNLYRPLNFKRGSQKKRRRAALQGVIQHHYLQKGGFILNGREQHLSPASGRWSVRPDIEARDSDGTPGGLFESFENGKDPTLLKPFPEELKRMSIRADACDPITPHQPVPG